MTLENYLLMENEMNEQAQPVSQNAVTTKELAHVLGVAKDTINATVERLELNGVLRRVDIKRNSQGGYLFNEVQATMLKKEIAKHHNLASRQIDTATTELEVISNALNAFKAFNDTVLFHRAAKYVHHLKEPQKKPVIPLFVFKTAVVSSATAVFFLFCNYRTIKRKPNAYFCIYDTIKAKTNP